MTSSAWSTPRTSGSCSGPASASATSSSPASRRRTGHSGRARRDGTGRRHPGANRLHRRRDDDAGHVFPSTACVLQHKIGAVNAWGFDLGAACSGFTYALTTGMQMVAGGAVSRALVVGADVMSSIIDYTDRATCVLFGDGAGAVVLSAAQEGEPAIIGFSHRDRRQRRPGAVHAGRRQPHAGLARDGRQSDALRQAGRPGRVQVRRPQDRGVLPAGAAGARHQSIRDRSLRLAPGQPPHHSGRRRSSRPARGARS